MDDFIVYKKLLIKNKTWIAIFVGLILIFSSTYNLLIKKPPVPRYQGTGSINVTNVVFADKSIPSVLLDQGKIDKIIEDTAKNLKLDKSDYQISIDSSVKNTIQITGTSVKSAGLGEYINGITHQYAELFRQLNSVNYNSTLNTLSEEYRKKIIDKNGQVSLSLLESSIKKVDENEAYNFARVYAFEKKLENYGYNIELTSFLINSIKSNVIQATGIEREEFIRKYVDLKTNLESYKFGSEYLKSSITTYNNILKEISAAKPLYNTLYNQVYNNDAINTKTVVSDASVGLVKESDTRIRSIIISFILSLVLVCFVILVLEYFSVPKKTRNEE